MTIESGRRANPAGDAAGRAGAAAAGRDRAADASATRAPIRLRRLPRIVGQTVVMAALSLFFLAGLFSVRGAGESAALVAVALLFAFLAVRAARSSVIVGDDGVAVRSVLRTRRLAWGDIEAFAVDSDSFGGHTAALLTMDERRVPLLAFSGIGWWDGNTFAFQRVCTQMGDLVDARKPAG